MCRVTHCDHLPTGVPVAKDTSTKVSESIDIKLTIVSYYSQFKLQPTFHFCAWVTFQENLSGDDQQVYEETNQKDKG